MIFALGNKMQNVMGPWIVQMGAMKKAAVSNVSSDSFYSLFSIPVFHFHSLLDVIFLTEVALGPGKNIGKLDLKSFLRIENARVHFIFFLENKH